MTESPIEREALVWLAGVGYQRPPYRIHFVIGL